MLTIRVCIWLSVLTLGICLLSYYFESVFVFGVLAWFKAMNVGNESNVSMSKVWYKTEYVGCKSVSGVV